MLKIHLAQILFSNSYYDTPNDCLEEPSPDLQPDESLGNLREEKEISNFLLLSKQNYISHITNKINSIASWSAQRSADVLVFPEYSIPINLLPDLKNYSIANDMHIIAGTHRVRLDDYSNSIYDQIGLAAKYITNGTAISPIFCPDGSTKASFKMRKSKWETNLVTPDSQQINTISIQKNGSSINFAVVPCIDCLHTEVLGKLVQSKTPNNMVHLIICPSCSPSITPFKQVGSVASLDDIVFSYANAATYGGSFFNIPENWKSYLKGFETDNEIKNDMEAVLELKVDPSKFFLKRGSINATPSCYHPNTFPIIYQDSSEWIKKFNQISAEIIESVENNDTEFSIEWLDDYLSEHGSAISPILKVNLDYLRHKLLPLFDGQIDAVKDLLDFVNIEEIPDTSYLYGDLIDRALNTLSKVIIESNDCPIDKALKSISALKKQQNKYPKVQTILESNSKNENIQNKISPIGDPNIIDSFQNRGNDLDILRDLFKRKEVRLIAITGAIGIGKSSFIEAFFKKVLTDWEIVRIKVGADTGFPRILADLGYIVGLSLNVDSLSYCNERLFKTKVIKTLKEYFNKSKRVLIIDDLHQLLIQRKSKDFKQLKLFIDEIISIAPIVGGKIIFLSSQFLPDLWLRQKGIAHHSLKSINSKYITRIIEFHMRKLQLFPEESSPSIPQKVLDLISGHPMSAKLFVEAIDSSEDKDFSHIISDIKTVRKYITKELIKKIHINDEDRNLLKQFSVFRFPVLFTALQEVTEFKKTKEQLLDLANRCILNFDGNRIEMHEAIRQHFLEQVDRQELEELHLKAVSYFKYLIELNKLVPHKDPTVYCEFAHHLSQTRKILEYQDIKSIIISEIKPSARKIYKNFHDYERALQIYRLINNIIPHDIEVIAYIGRCYARLKHWGECDEAFNKAVLAAKKEGSPYWWIYRDWGHMKARFGFYSEALELFDKASDGHLKDCSIISSKAYMHWRQGMNVKAKELFEEALEINDMHEYTLLYYSKLLENEGDNEYAEILLNRLDDIGESDINFVPTEFDIEDDFDD